MTPKQCRSTIDSATKKVSEISTSLSDLGREHRVYAYRGSAAIAAVNKMGLAEYAAACFNNNEFDAAEHLNSAAACFYCGEYPAAKWMLIMHPTEREWSDARHIRHIASAGAAAQQLARKFSDAGISVSDNELRAAVWVVRKPNDSDMEIARSYGEKKQTVSLARRKLSEMRPEPSRPTPAPSPAPKPTPTPSPPAPQPNFEPDVVAPPWEHHDALNQLSAKELAAYMSTRDDCLAIAAIYAGVSPKTLKMAFLKAAHHNERLYKAAGH